MMKKMLVMIPAIVLIAIGLYFVLVTSVNVRYWADDFCSAALLGKAGFLGTQISLWNTWTGRFSATFFISLAELAGPWIVRILPILILVLLLVSLWKFYRINRLIPVLFILLTLINAPNTIQSFYWQTGSLNYLAPFIFLNIFLGIVIFPSKKINIFLPFVLTLIAAGFSEAFAIAQLVLILFVLLAVKLISFSGTDKRMKIVLSGLAGAIMALGIIYLAPGNLVRAGTVNHLANLKQIIVSTLYSTKWYLPRMLSIKTFDFSLLIIFTAILVLAKDVKLKLQHALTLAALSVVSAIFITMSVLASGFYSIAIIPPERALFVAIYMMLICFVVFSFAVKSLIKSGSKVVWIILLMNLITSFILIGSLTSQWGIVNNSLKTYATEWDNAEKELPLLKNIHPVGELDGFTDNKGWVGACVAGYYKLTNVKMIK